MSLSTRSMSLSTSLSNVDRDVDRDIERDVDRDIEQRHRTHVSTFYVSVHVRVFQFYVSVHVSMSLSTCVLCLCPRSHVGSAIDIETWTET